MKKAHEQPRQALGKGLGSLLPTRPAAEPASHSVSRVRIDQIDPNPLQPRRAFDADRLQELAQSIRSNGIIQPLVLRRHGERYQLVAGERRWRAAKVAGLAEVPVVVQDIPDQRLLEITLIENVQREDLNPIETAVAFDRLSRELSLSYEAIGLRTGKDRTTIQNLVRLLQLPDDVQALIGERKLSAGHGRSLLALPTAAMQQKVAEKTVARGWSVRELERLIKRLLATRQPEEEERIDPNVKAAIDDMERVLGTKVRIIEKANHKGRIEIEYYSAEDLQRIYAEITGSTT